MFIGNQYSRLLRQQHDSKALSASKGTVRANRGKGKNRRPNHKFDGNCFNCGKKRHRARDCKSVKKSETSGAVDKKKGGGSGRCYICGSEEQTRPTIRRERGCNKFVPVLGGDVTKIAPAGDISDQLPGGMS